MEVFSDSTVTYRSLTEEATRQAILEDPVVFARLILKETPHEAQVKLLRGMRRKKHVAASCGRKWGKSLALAWYIIWYMVTHKGRKVMIVGPTMQQAKIVFSKVLYYFSRVPALKAMLAKKPVMTPFPKIELENETEFCARGAANPEYIRGEEAHLVIVDEAAYVKDLTIQDVIEPMFMVTMSVEDTQIILISTPAGMNVFYEWFQLGQSKERKNSDYVSFQFPTSSNPYHDKKYLARQREVAGENSIKWRAEYLAEFIDSALAIFSWNDILRAIDKYEECINGKVVGEKSKTTYIEATVSTSPMPGHKYVQGVDVADAGKDFTVCSVFDYTDPQNIVLVRMDRLNRVGWAKVYATIRANYERYNHCLTHVDITGLGAALLEELKDINATGYKIGTNQAKQELVNRAVRAFNQGVVALPSDRDITSEFRYFQATLTPSGAVKMEASKGHDDIVLSVCLALFPILVDHTIGFFRATNIGIKKEDRESNGKPNLAKQSDEVFLRSVASRRPNRFTQGW